MAPVIQHMQQTDPKQFLLNLCQAAHDTRTAAAKTPVFLGTLPITPLDHERAGQMAAARRLFNEAPDDGWGARGTRHRGDEATQAKTWADGCLGEAVIGRVMRQSKSPRIKVSAPVEWRPSTDPDLIYAGKTFDFSADIKAAEYRHKHGGTTWSINAQVHERGAGCIDGYLAADLADKDQGICRCFWYPYEAIEQTGCKAGRKAVEGVSKFFVMAFPKG